MVVARQRPLALVYYYYKKGAFVACVQTISTIDSFPWRSGVILAPFSQDY